MATVIADNILSPLGSSTAANLQAVMSGETGLRMYTAHSPIPFPFTASLFSDQQTCSFAIDGYTKFESLAITSIKEALACTHIPMDSRTVLILSSTKGNVGLLQLDNNSDDVSSIAVAAQKVAKAVGVTTEPIVVCNACISGLSAMILANRLVDDDAYDYAIVCGADVQNLFIISGFQSLKALSETECRPFDIERLGLNLGEAAATVIISKNDAHGAWQIANGGVRNDAIHITNPSPKGDGAAMAIATALDSIESQELAQINAHGTATMFNDQMESKAISQIGLSDVPVNGLKGYFGHTMGAAGILETIITMHAIDHGVIIGTRGFEEIGVSGKINISAENRPTDKQSFVKIISGFGGCNAALLMTKTAAAKTRANGAFEAAHRVRITPTSVEIDGENLDFGETGLKLITAIYKEKVGDYPKFYKMDPLARLGFVATELLLKTEGSTQTEGSESRGVVLFNSNGSINADIEYLKTVSDPDNFFPSPSLFVYTLPNIVTGEIAIRNKYFGETAFYVLPHKDAEAMDSVLKATFTDKKLTSLITGWLEYKNENDFEADLFIASKPK